ncbi:MAG: DUF4386 domain-containing protein [Candidatus Nanopelagicales bacterium]
MSAVVWAAALLVVLPIAFNVAFAALAATFDYPDVLRHPTHEVLAKFRSGGRRLILTWWAFALTAVALVPLAVLVSAALPDSDPTVRTMATTVGVLAGLVQFLGLVRWPFLVPYLASVSTDDSPERREAVDVVFQSFNRYLGVAVGEHLGYLFTGAWTALVGVLVVQSSAAPSWLGLVGVVVGILLVVCSLEFVGRGGDDEGWSVAATITPVVYIAWSLWLVALGVALLL